MKNRVIYLVAVLQLMLWGCRTSGDYIIPCHSSRPDSECVCLEKPDVCYQRCEADTDCPSGYACACDRGHSVCSAGSVEGMLDFHAENVCVRL